MKTHLEQAVTLIRQSDANLLEAAAHIKAAREEDTTLTLRQVGAALDRSPQWVRALLSWAESHEEGESMFAADTDARLERAVRTGLKNMEAGRLTEILTALADTDDERVRLLQSPIKNNETPGVTRYVRSFSITPDWDNVIHTIGEPYARLTDTEKDALYLNEARESRSLMMRAWYIAEHAREWTPGERAEVLAAFEAKASGEVEHTTRLLAEVRNALAPQPPSVVVGSPDGMIVAH